MDLKSPQIYSNIWVTLSSCYSFHTACLDTEDLPFHASAPLGMPWKVTGAAPQVGT